MASLLNNDVKGIIHNLLFKHCTMKCCTKYKNTYSENEGIVMLHGVVAYNYRDLGCIYRIFRLDSWDGIMKMTTVFTHYNY